MERERINWKELIKEGNIVKVRQFDDMEKQYGYRYVGGVKVINVYMSFTEDMKKICGDVINIDEETEKNYKERGYFYYQGFSISTDMLEPYIVHEEEKGEDIMERDKINWKEIIKENNEVKVRQWGDMAKEYGEYCSANKSVINCSKKFTKDMEKYCGKIIKINEKMAKKFNECGYFYYEDYVFSTDMLEPYEEELDVINIPVKDEYLKDLHEEKQEKEISYLEKEWGIKDNILYGIIYESEQTGERKLFGEIINFNPYQVFIIDDKMGLAVLSIKNIISMIPIKIREKN